MSRETCNADYKVILYPDSMSIEIGNRLSHLLMLKNGGNQSELARYCGVTPQAVQQWMAGKTVPRAGKLKLAAEFLNSTPEEILFGVKASEMERAPPLLATSGGDPVLVPIMNAVAAMGAGEVLPEHDAVVGGLTLDKGWVRRNISVTSPSNLAVISGYGNSMEPTFKDGDLLLVDRGVTTVAVEGIYVFELGRSGERMGYIKTIQRRPGGVLRAISDNKTYDAWDIPQDAEFRVLGRVVWAWNGKKL